MKSEVFLMDCMEGMARYPDKYFDLAVVDPPYGIGVSKMAYLTECKTMVRQKNGSKLKPRKTIYKKSEWDNKPPPQEYFDELFRISKHQIIWGINYFDLNKIGSGRIKWNKLVNEKLSFNSFEYAYCSMIDSEIEFIFKYSGFNVGISLHEPSKSQRNMSLIPQRIHPTQKPISLYNWIYKTFLLQGGKVLDTHLGSGSNRIAADKAGNIDFTGFEIDKEYFEAAEKRFNNFKSQLTLQFA